MFDKLKNLFVKPRDDRDGWLTADNPAELNLAKSFQRTGVINQMNFISMMQDPVTQQYWIEHVSAVGQAEEYEYCLLYTSPSPRDATLSRMPSSA